MATVDDARRVLGALKDAGSGRELLELGWIQQLRLEQNRAVFRLALPSFAASQRDRIAGDARSPASLEAAAGRSPGSTTATTRTT